MTDPDDLASAHLDDATTPEEAAQVTADPALLARVEELRAVRDAVAAVPPADPARREEAMAAALAAFVDAGEAAVERVTSAARVTSRATVAARRGPSPRAIRLLGAAAALVLLALLVPVLGQLGRDDADTAARFEETGAAIGGNTPPGPESAAEDSEHATSTAAAPLADLGAFDDLAGLVATFRDAAGLEAATGFVYGADSRRDCANARSTDAVSQGAGVVTTAIATLGGEPVVTLLISEPEGARTLLVLRAGDCTLLAERSL